MTIRACIYKNCENYINLKDRSVNNHVTLFSFPKNPERRKLWMELGKVPPNLPASMYYFCIDHFDKKYLSINNVRKILVGDAVPYPFEEQELVQEPNEDETTNGNLDYFLYDLNKESDIVERHDLQDGQDLHVESTTLTNEIEQEFQNEHYSLNFEEEKSDGEGCIIVTDEENTQISAIISSSKKRKLDESNNIIQMQASSSKAKLLKTSSPQKSLRKSYGTTETSIKNPIVGSNETIEEDIKEKQLIDAAHVTTFIFKGEEYVQMPKDHYVKEKLELMRKLRKMESVVKTIKQHLNSLDV